MGEKAALTVCGLGTRPPLEITLEALRALREARAAFCDLDPKESAWLRRRVPGLRAASSPAEILEEAAKGGAALAVWGHPQLCSPLAAEALELARARGLSCEVLGAISPVGSVFARTGSFLGGDYGYQGIQAYELARLLADTGLLDPKLPLVVFSRGAEDAAWERLRELLGRSYPSSHRVHIDEASAEEPREAALADLSAPAPGAAVILVPPRPA